MRGRVIGAILLCWAGAIGLIWMTDYKLAKAQYYHALVAEEAALEAESAWGLMAIRVDRLALPESSYNHARAQAVATGLMREDITRERVALEGRLRALTFGRFVPEDR